MRRLSADLTLGSNFCRNTERDSMFSPRPSVHLLLLTVALFTRSGAQKLTITPDKGTSISIWSSQDKGCKVCTMSGRSRQCNTSLLLKGSAATVVEFDCSRPQDVFSVEIVRNIECGMKSCSGHIIHADSGSLPLLAFNRKFTWDLDATMAEGFEIDFTSTGLRQINASEGCPDRHSYTLQAAGDVAVGKYCRTGHISRGQIFRQGKFSLEVPGGQKLNGGQFDVTGVVKIKSLARITVTLPKGKSSVELLSPNYPESFPDDDVMEWYFELPLRHKAVVQLLKAIQPHCLKKSVAMEYNATGVSVRRLTEPQPDQSNGNFTMKLRNCEMNRRRAGSPGLSLSFKVSSSSISSTASCKVDTGKLEGASLHIKKLRPSSDCEMKINSMSKDEITVTSNSDLWFQDCFPEDVQVTATRAIECKQLKDCPKTPVRLMVPLLPSCIPAPLSSVTWSLRPPRDGTVELTSPIGPLKQALPGQPCNDSIVVKIAEEDGTVGNFCPLGAIHKIQIHSNVSVTVSGMAGKVLRFPVLNAVVKAEITEKYIFSVSPKRDTPLLLATPGWPAGMVSSISVSWIVTVPPKMEAHLMFANLTQPKCSNRHTNIRVQRTSSKEDDYSRREDEKAEDVTVSESFYLNMSNCEPERGDFSVITKITLTKSTNMLLTIILSVVAVLLVIFVIVLVVVCVVIRKKKKKLNKQVSIYNPNGTIFLPGHNSVPETREEDDHEYASIEDTLVYTHLLRKGREIGIYGEFDTYRPFTGRTDSQKPLVAGDPDLDEAHKRKQQFQASSQKPPPLPNRPLSHGQGLVDNVIYQAEDQIKEEDSVNLGPRLDPEGGN